MAANKFATMLHRNTNKMTLILVYAILEWVLIILLLLNSLFSYLIVKFADYFGLKRPCLWCSRLDHIIEPGKNHNFRGDLICEAHALEISKLGFCLSHRKLTESQYLCEDCSSCVQPDCPEWSKFAFFPWMKKIGIIQDGDDKVVENREENLRCSCCGASLNYKLYPPCILIKPSWGDSDYTQKGNLIVEAEIDDKSEKGDHDESRSKFVNSHEEYEKGIEEKLDNQMVSGVDDCLGTREEEAEENGSCSFSDICSREIEADEDGKVSVLIAKEQTQEPIREGNLVVPMEDQVHSKKDECPQHFEFYIAGDDCRLVPIELLSSTTTDNQSQHKFDEQGNSDNQDVILDFDMNIRPQVGEIIETWHSSEKRVPLAFSTQNKKETNISVVESKGFCPSENSLVFHVEEGDYETWEFQQADMPKATQTLSNGDGEVNSQANARIGRGDIDMDTHQDVATDDDSHTRNDENEPEISIGTEIPDQEPMDYAESQEMLPAYPSSHEDSFTTPLELHISNDHDSEKPEEDLGEFTTLSVETNHKSVNDNVTSELNEIEEEKVPDTPTSLDSIHLLHKKFLILERREPGTEESLDGSVLSDIDESDGVPTTEKLKSALKVERKALYALYAELEEERSASAVAANQTMAMINRLQEEKAAMQMEALQYQRMMEEQSDYDQESLQLLNELMVKREKEKQEVEKELEIYRRRVHEYEAKEKMMLRKMKDGSTRSRTSSVSCSNAEESEEDGFDGHEDVSNQNTPADEVLYLEESLDVFEEERLSILDQLRVLEQNLCTLSDEDEQLYEDITPIDGLCTENGNGYHDHFGVGIETNGVSNGHLKETNGKHHQERRLMGAKAKQLLPLFNAIETKTGDVIMNENKDGSDSDNVLSNSSVTEFERESRKFAIEEEVDHVYERLQALEADREFLKHCISSLRKGDKGLVLLQEILQHLRDLRSFEFHSRNMGDGVL